MDLPSIGFGCSPYRNTGEVVDLSDAFVEAWRAGYRLFDSAELYGNEASLGRALRSPKAPPRHDLFVVSKVWDTNHAFDHATEACERSLGIMGLEYLDAYMIHSPQSLRHTGPLDFPPGSGREAVVAMAYPATDAGVLDTIDIPVSETWRALEALYDRGLVRHLGLCNFDTEKISQVIEIAKIPPTLVQIAFNPFERQEDVLSFCRQRGISVIGHSPLSPIGLLVQPDLEEIAARHRKTPAQTILRWAVQKGVVPIPSSADPDHITANLDIQAFHLSDSDMKIIDDLGQRSVHR